MALNKFWNVDIRWNHVDYFIIICLEGFIETLSDYIQFGTESFASAFGPTSGGDGGLLISSSSRRSYGLRDLE